MKYSLERNSRIFTCKIRFTCIGVSEGLRTAFGILTKELMQPAEINIIYIIITMFFCRILSEPSDYLQL